MANSCTELVIRIYKVRANVSRSRRHQIAVLKDFAKLAGRLHGSQQGHLGFRRCFLEVEQPLQVLSRQSRAGADQVLDQNFFRGVRIAQPEAREHVDYWFIPLDLVVGDQLRRRSGFCRLR